MLHNAVFKVGLVRDLSPCWFDSTSRIDPTSLVKNVFKKKPRNSVPFQVFEQLQVPDIAVTSNHTVPSCIRVKNWRMLLLVCCCTSEIFITLPALNQTKNIQHHHNNIGLKPCVCYKKETF